MHFQTLNSPGGIWLKYLNLKLRDVYKYNSRVALFRTWWYILQKTGFSWPGLSWRHGMVLQWFLVAFLRFLVGGQSTEAICFHITSWNLTTLHEKREVDPSWSNNGHYGHWLHGTSSIYTAHGGYAIQHVTHAGWAVEKIHRYTLYLCLAWQKYSSIPMICQSAIMGYILYTVLAI